jgi:hypothetical protein
MNDTQKFVGDSAHDSYQLYVCASPAHFPLSVWMHTWIVTVAKGKCTRYEVRHYKNKISPSLGYIHIDGLPPFNGLGIIPATNNPRWKTTVLYSVSGPEHSLAHRLVEATEASISNYQHKNRYSLVGPNSNTYIQSILRSVTECDYLLPTRAIGSHY